MDSKTEPALWFLNGRVNIQVASAAGADGISVLQYHAPSGDSPPLHIHETEDEIFHILEGELRFRVGDREITARAGDTVLAPKGVPHTYRVESPPGARWLTIVRGTDFENFVRAFSRPAERDGLPDPAPPPTPEEAAALEEACRAHRIAIVGPPLDPKPTAPGA